MKREREKESNFYRAPNLFSRFISFLAPPLPSPPAFSFHKLVRLDSDPIERSIHRGTISISPGSSQRSAFRVLPIIDTRGREREVRVLPNGRSNYWPPSRPLLVSCLLVACDFPNRFTVISSPLCPRIGDEWTFVCCSVVKGWGRLGGIEIYRNSFVTSFVSSLCTENIVEAHCWEFTRVLRNHSGIIEKVFANFFFFIFLFFIFP